VGDGSVTCEKRCSRGFHREDGCYCIGMRIAQVAPRGEQPWSGVLTVIVHLAAALARRGHRVEVWRLHEWPPDDYADQHRLLQAAGVAQVPVRSSRRLGRSAATLAEERGIDVVHLHGAFNPSNTAISRALRRPYVFSPHAGYDAVSLRRSRGRKAAYRILFERRMLERAASLVALTNAELADIRAFGATRPCEVIPNGVERSAEDLDAEAFRRALGLPHDALLAVFVGRLDVHRKGLDVLVRGVSEAPGWHLALVGPRFRDVERLERMIADLRLGDRVHLVGERHGRSLRESVRAADLFVLMSRWEGLPMVLLEALALGRPAVVSGAVEGSVPVAGAGAGWVAGDADLGTVLREITRMGRHELAERGRAALLLSQRYDWDSVAQSYEAVYERAEESRPRVTP
jgi:glycosyltransferase involved in cell wall biosynthesis